MKEEKRKRRRKEKKKEKISMTSNKRRACKRNTNKKHTMRHVRKEMRFGKS
jgi:hypothetical protein